MPNQDQFHALLRERVESTRKDHEAAVTLLREFERMFFKGTAPQAQATPAPRPAPTPPAPEPRAEARTDETRGANKDGSARKKPGPAKGVNVNKNRTQARAKASAKAAQPAKTKKVAKGTQQAKAKTKSNGHVKAKTKAAQKVSTPGPKPGSKRERDRSGVPSLIKGIQMVMGRSTINAEEVHNLLKAKGWLPSSSDPLGYIRYTLSKNKDIFLRVDGRRGFYHLDQSNPFYSGKSGDKKNGTAKASSTNAHVEPVETASANENADAVVDEVDDLLSKSGVDISGPNPFADQSAS